MSDQKKYGTFAGVFTPSILTILGVMMYLLFGKVVGNAGLAGTIIIIVIAHIISITTGLSVSSISTDKKVGAGGVYYVLSRSLGLPIGGALGITLFIATAISIALYMVGFAEVFNATLDINLTEVNKIIDGEEVKYYLVQDESSFFNGWSDIDLIRLTGSIGLLLLTIIALISTSIAIKTQFIILILIVLSLIAIWIGDPSLATVFFEKDVNSVNKLDYFEVFALFFPAVTGFTAGVAMSGDLKDPKKSIPRGTMLAIIVGFLVYLLLALFIYYNFSKSTLIENRNILYEITMYGGIFVILGAIGATLSSALGGILGGPRILQAMSVDKITPKLFSKGVGKGNEPRNALLLTVLIAEGGVLIGELEIIATILTVFYLAAYGFINLSFFLESWASADFNPSFKVNKWFGLIGFVATFTVMSQISILAMIMAFIIIGGIYIFLNNRQIALGTGDIWQSVWSTVVKKGLRKMEATNDHKRNWKPNILLFSTGHSERAKFIEFSKSVSGQAGIITNFDLIENTEASVLFPKHKQSVKDEELEKYGIFGRQIEVQNEFQGIESIASTFGFSGMEPNTILMPWPGETKDPIWFTNMTQKLFDLDYNVLYLDYDKRWGFRKKEQIDLWWRNVGNNAELMLSLIKFISASTDWAKANIRVLLVNDTNTENQVIEGRIQKILDEFRVKASIKIISNKLDQIPIYELMKLHSSEADLVFVGIPEVSQPADFIKHTNELINTIGTTLLVKASSQFEETDLKVESIDLLPDIAPVENSELKRLDQIEDIELNKAISLTDTVWDDVFKSQLTSAISKIETYHHQQISKIQKQITGFISDLKSEDDIDIWAKIDHLLIQANKIIEDDIQYQLPEVYQQFDTAISNYIAAKEESIYDLPHKIILNKRRGSSGQIITGAKKINFKRSVNRLWVSEGKTAIQTQLLEFGYQNFILIHQHKNKFHQAIRGFIEAIGSLNDINGCIKECEESLSSSLSAIDTSALAMTQSFYQSIRQSDRLQLNKLSRILEKTSFTRELQERLPYLSRKNEKTLDKALLNYSGYWQRNMVLFSLNFQADVYLLKYAANAEATLLQVTIKNESTYLDTLKTNIATIFNDIERLESILKDQDKKTLNQFNLTITQEVFFNLDDTVQFVLEKLNDALDKIPESIELMTAKSINNVRKVQGESISTLNIQLDDIADYLTKVNYYKPFKDILSSYINQLKKTAAIVLNGSFKIQADLDALSKTNDLTLLKGQLIQVKNDCIEAHETVTSLHQTFLLELNTLHHQLNETLDINKIVEQYETLYPQAKLESKGRKLKGQVRQYQNKLIAYLHKLITSIVQKKESSEKSQHEAKHRHILSPIGEYSSFIDTIRIKPKVQLNLPYYYNQLFNSKYYSDTNTIIGRSDESEQVSIALEKLSTGKNGCIMILGESLSGKTFFLNHLAQNHLKNTSIYKLKLSAKKTNAIGALQKSLQTATGIQEPTPTIMRQLNKRAVFIIDDIETWYLNVSDGEKTINSLNQFIHQHSHSHYFILTGNLHSFSTIKLQTNINDTVISTVILKPLTSLEITKVIETRHQLGGMTYLYKNVSENFLSPTKRLKLMQRFFSLSKGNIGIALKLWVSSIELVDENKITINPTPELDLPPFPNEIWRSLLYQFQIHQNLTFKNLIHIYGDENKDWIIRYTNQLVMAGLVENQEKNIYTIPSDIRYFIEETYDK